MARNARHHLEPTSIDTADMAPRELTKQEFGRRLQALHLDKGWNQSELARRADLGRDAVSSYIRGVSFPEPKNLHKLARALGVEVGVLLPNAVIRAMDADRDADIEIKEAVGHPGKAWIKINRMVSSLVAAKIYVMLQEDEVKP